MINMNWNDIDEQTGKPGMAMGLCWCGAAFVGIIGWIIILAIMGAVS